MVDVTVQFRWRCRFCGRFVADPTCVDPVRDLWEWTCSRCGDCYGGPPDIASWPACREVQRVHRLRHGGRPGVGPLHRRGSRHRVRLSVVWDGGR